MIEATLGAVLFILAILFIALASPKPADKDKKTENNPPDPT